MKDINLLIALPVTTNLSGCFLSSWCELLSDCVDNNINPIVSIQKDRNLYAARNRCLQFNDRSNSIEVLDYDFMLWLDQAVMFKTNQVIKLLNHHEDIVSGFCITDEKGNCNFGYDLSTLSARENELRLSRYKDRNEYLDDDLIDVDWVGLEFILVKKGVFETLNYPWFNPVEHNTYNKNYSISIDEMNWCKSVKHHGFRIKVDSSIIVGKEIAIAI